MVRISPGIQWTWSRTPVTCPSRVTCHVFWLDWATEKLFTCKMVRMVPVTCHMSVTNHVSHFWLCQELRESLCLSVRPSRTKFSKVLNLHLSHLTRDSLKIVSGQAQVSLRSVSDQSQVSLRSLWAYFISKTEPKILRLDVVKPKSKVKKSKPKGLGLKLKSHVPPTQPHQQKSANSKINSNLIKDKILVLGLDIVESQV